MPVSKNRPKPLCLNPQITERTVTQRVTDCKPPNEVVGKPQISRRGRGRTDEARASLTDQRSQYTCLDPTRAKNPHRGTRVDDWLKAEGIFEDVTQKAIKEVIAWQLAEAMKAENITKTEMARRMNTSRFQLDRVLDPKNVGVSLDTLNRAAAAIGRKVRLELV